MSPLPPPDAVAGPFRRATDSPTARNGSAPPPPPWPQAARTREKAETVHAVTTTVLDAPRKGETIQDLLDRGVPVYRFTVPLDPYSTLRVISKREARRRDRRKQRARKHATAAWQRRHRRREAICFWALMVIIVAGLAKLPEDPFHKRDVPPPRPAALITRTTVTP